MKKRCFFGQNPKFLQIFRKFISSLKSFILSSQVHIFVILQWKKYALFPSDSVSPGPVGQNPRFGKSFANLISIWKKFSPVIPGSYFCNIRWKKYVFMDRIRGFCKYFANLFQVEKSFLLSSQVHIFVIVDEKKMLYFPAIA